MSPTKILVFHEPSLAWEEASTSSPLRTSLLPDIPAKRKSREIPPKSAAGSKFSVSCNVESELTKNVVSRFGSKPGLQCIVHPRTSICTTHNMTGDFDSSNGMQGHQWVGKPRVGQASTTNISEALFKLDGQVDNRVIDLIWAIELEETARKRRGQSCESNQKVRIRKVIAPVLTMLLKGLKWVGVVRRSHFSEVRVKMLSKQLPASLILAWRDITGIVLLLFRQMENQLDRG